MGMRKKCFLSLFSQELWQFPYALIPPCFCCTSHPSWVGHLASALVKLGEAKLLGITQVYPGLAL